MVKLDTDNVKSTPPRKCNEMEYFTNIDIFDSADIYSVKQTNC
jgi:hypothetical protein